MKSSIILFFLFLSLWGKSQKSNTLKNENLKGNIKTVESFNYEVINKNGEIQKGKRTSSTQKIFNEKGFILSEVGQGMYIGENFETSYTYDTSAIQTGHIRLIERHTKRYNDSKSKEVAFTSTTTYKYDGGFVYSEQRNSVNSDIRRFTSTLNSVGKDSIVIGYNENGTEIGPSSKYFYDNKGNNTEWISVYNNKKTTSKSSYKFDKYGNEIEYINSSNDDVLFADGTSGKGISETRTKTYSSYDKNMNWLKMIEYRNGVPVSIKERVIIYN